MENKGFLNIVRGIEKAAAENIIRNACDYTNSDGMLVCGKCHTPKQFRFEVMGEVLTPFCLCRCGLEEREKAEKAIRDKAEQTRIAENRKNAFGGSDMMNWTFKSDDKTNERITRICQRYVEMFDEMYKNGKGLLFYGSVGTGKSFYAACIANALIDKGKTCYMTNFMSLINTPIEDRVKVINDLNKYNLLIIDDFSAERETEFMQENVLNVIDARYRIKKPLIITTNLNANELKNPTDLRRVRINSRLFEMCIPIEVTGKDRRKEKLKKDFDEMRDLLGL